MPPPETCARHVIGIGGLEVRCGPGEIATYALGSCLGITIHDPTSGIGGMLHAQLPCAARNPERFRETPGLFVDSGLELLFARAVALGANRRRLRVAVAGAASMSAVANDVFNIPQQNLTALRKAFWAMGVMVGAQDTGGNEPRTLFLDLASGATTVLMCGQRKNL
ncbi:MAG: chemotaxis protein CheD [Planctomycetes bacterium]|nr:chemotaxis protein CheD [Planctomycetota bacterium]